MRCFDISQEVFSSAVYPGDPAPRREVLRSMDKGDCYHLTAFSMCAHNGTHVDAPAHFLKGGASVEKLPLSSLVGPSVVVSFEGEMSAEDAKGILVRAGQVSGEGAVRLLLKGQTTVGRDAAEVLLEGGVLLLGTERQSVSKEEDTAAVHRLLLEGGTLLLEGLRLEDVSDGGYFLFAAPLLLGGAEGAPCRAVLVDFSNENSDNL